MPWPIWNTNQSSAHRLALARGCTYERCASGTQYAQLGCFYPRQAVSDVSKLKILWIFLKVTICFAVVRPYEKLSWPFENRAVSLLWYTGCILVVCLHDWQYADGTVEKWHLCTMQATYICNAYVVSASCCVWQDADNGDKCKGRDGTSNFTVSCIRGTVGPYQHQHAFWWSGSSTWGDPPVLWSQQTHRLHQQELWWRWHHLDQLWWQRDGPSYISARTNSQVHSFATLRAFKVNVVASAMHQRSCAQHWLCTKFSIFTSNNLQRLEHARWSRWEEPSTAYLSLNWVATWIQSFIEWLPATIWGCTYHDLYPQSLWRMRRRQKDGKPSRLSINNK